MKYAYEASDRGLDPACRLCQSLSHLPAPAEDLIHVLTRCRATADTRGQYLPEVLNTVATYIPNCGLFRVSRKDFGIGGTGRGAKRGGAREHCSKKEMDRIIPGRRIWSISTALVAILINRAIYPSVEVLIKRIFFCEIDI